MVVSGGRRASIDVTREAVVKMVAVFERTGSIRGGGTIGRVCPLDRPSAPGSGRLGRRGTDAAGQTR